jgi:hypothetical protein
MVDLQYIQMVAMEWIIGRTISKGKLMAFNYNISFKIKPQNIYYILIINEE